MIAEDRMTHTIHFLSVVLKDDPTRICYSKLVEIEAVRTIFANLQTVESLPPESPKVLPHPTPVVTHQASAPLQYPTPTSKVVQDKERATTSKGVF